MEHACKVWSDDEGYFCLRFETEAAARAFIRGGSGNDFLTEEEEDGTWVWHMDWI